MKKIKYLFLIYIFFICLNVSALNECTSEEMTRLKELADNVSFQYKANVEDVKLLEEDEYMYKEAYYTIQAFNIDSSLKVHVKDSDIYFSNQEDDMSGFMNGENVIIEFIAYTKNLCSGKVITTKTINLPYFNLFSLRNECKDYPEFKYCSEYGDYSISEEEFLKELGIYQQNSGNSNNKNKDSEKSAFIAFLEKYEFEISLTIGIIGFILLTLIVIKKNLEKDRDLK